MHDKLKQAFLKRSEWLQPPVEGHVSVLCAEVDRSTSTTHYAPGAASPRGTFLGLTHSSLATSWALALVSGVRGSCPHLEFRTMR